MSVFAPLSLSYAPPAGFAPDLAQPLVLHTQAEAARHWPGLRVQLHQEPLCVGPVLVPPKPQAELVVQLAGQLHFGIRRAGRQRRTRTGPGSVFLTAANQLAYELEWLALAAEPVRTVHVHVAAELLARTAAEHGLPPDRLELRDGSGLPDPLLRQLGQQLAAELHYPPDPAGSLRAETLGQQLAAHLVRQHATTRPPRLPRTRLTAAQVRHVQAYVQAHLTGAVALTELAACVCLSPYHFCRAFKQTTGFSPNQYVIYQRIQRARQLLASGRWSVTQVAFEVGYANPSYFAQLFRRYTGYAPGRPTPA